MSKQSSTQTSEQSSSKKSKEKMIPSKSSQKDEEEPGFREYAIIVVGIIAIFIVLYVGFEWYDSYSKDDGPMSAYEQVGIEDEGFTYQTQAFRGGTANIEFVYNLQTLEQFDFKQEFTQNWISQNKKNLTIATPGALKNTTQNGLLIKSSGKFAQYLRFVEGVRFNNESFKTIDSTTQCEVTSSNSSLIIFNYNTSSDVSVEINSEYPNCITINSGETTIGFVQAVDKIMYDRIFLNK